MFDVHKEGRDRAEAEAEARARARAGIDPVYLKWGEDRRDADAFLMTQAMHTEIAVSELKTVLMFIGIGALAWAEGYHSVAWGAAAVGFMMVALQETALKRRHARVSRLMEKNLD